MIKDFLVTIIAHGYRTKFPIKAEDSPESIEQSIVDKLGEKSIKWESSGMFSDARRITYEEVINDPRSVQTEKILGVELGAGV